MTVKLNDREVEIDAPFRSLDDVYDGNFTYIDNGQELSDVEIQQVLESFHEEISLECAENRGADMYDNSKYGGH